MSGVDPEITLHQDGPFCYRATINYTSDTLDEMAHRVAERIENELTQQIIERLGYVKPVRCRDCKFYTPESMTREERGFGVYENMWEPGGCFNPERCSATWDSIAGQMVPVGIVTEPDGFCAWGKRKEETE